MKPLAASAAIVLAVAMNALPALAAQFVQDGAGMFSSATVSQLDTQIGNFNAQTQKQIVVVTVPSLNGETVQNAAQSVFSEQQINGVLIFIAKAERKDIIVPGRATAQFFPASTTTSIRQQMESSFRNGDFDGGITTAVGSILDVFRSHVNSMPGNANAYGRNYPAPSYQRPVATTNGIHLSMFWWIVLIVVGFLVIRSIFRSMGAGRNYGGRGGPAGGPGYGPGPGYGYGPGYYGGGGGGFWSGLLGGLGGAWLGNEMFNRGGGGSVDPNAAGGGIAPVDQGGGWGGNAPDAGGWGSDAGQADMGSSSAGDWGGGGFGGGDVGGGGGGFGGGGGGDSGGGW